VGRTVIFGSCWRRLAVVPVAAVLVTALGCCRPAAVTNHQSTAQAQTASSSSQGEGNETVGELVRSALSAGSDASRESKLRFQKTLDLPPGTLLTVRLNNAVYASASAAEASFEAVVAEAVLVGGDMVIPKGASVRGRVESARTSKIKPNRGYVRLALESLQVGEQRIPVQTASLFAREAPLGEDPIAVIHLEKGRRLTFRLSDAAERSDQHVQLTR
jgi:hypothetical protein